MLQAEKVPELAVRLMGGGQEIAKEVRGLLLLVVSDKCHENSIKKECKLNSKQLACSRHRYKQLQGLSHVMDISPTGRSHANVYYSKELVIGPSCSQFFPSRCAPISQ